MERSSWPAHFRNCRILRRDWHTGPFSGTIGRLLSPAFCWKQDLRARMGNRNSIRGCRGAMWCALFGIVLSGAALADSSATTTGASPSTASKPQTAQTQINKGTKSSASGSTTHKSTSHTSTSHKAPHKSGSHKSSGQKTTPSRGKNGSKNLRSSKKRGQQAIDHDRAQAIQEALIREHYLQGEPSGTWDATTQEAMKRYQADQGWQYKTTPDSRALIKLGLGPSNDHLLNPESAMTSAPAAAASKTKPDPAQNSLPHQ